MKRTRIATVVLLAVLTVGIGLSRAEDQAPAVAPADSAPKVAEPAGGCMPDGSCCGNAACAHAVFGADKTVNGVTANEAAGSNAADGGCQCAKMKKAM